MLGTPPQDELHKHLHISNACEHSWIMMIMIGSKMSKAEYDLKAILYPVYKLCNIRGGGGGGGGGLKYPATSIAAQ